MHKEMLTRNKLIFSLSISSLFLGFMLATQYRITQHTNDRLSVGRGSGELSELQKSVLNMQQKNQALENQVNELNKQMMDLEKSSGSQTKDLRSELEKARIMAGTTAVVGDGISFQIEDDPLLQQGGKIDSDRYVHDHDVQMLITELFLGGAEAIAINGQRITYASRIQCIGPTIVIDDHKSTIPFVFQAIGDKSVLLKSLNLPGGVLDYMKNKRKLKVTGPKEEVNMKLPPYRGSFNNILEPGQKAKAD